MLLYTWKHTFMQHNKTNPYKTSSRHQSFDVFRFLESFFSSRTAIVYYIIGQKIVTKKTTILTSLFSFSGKQIDLFNKRM